MRTLVSILTILGLIGVAAAQNPPSRPDIQWMIGAPNNYTYAPAYQISLTDDQKYLMTSDDATQEVYRTDWILNRPRHALATFDQTSLGAFSSPCEPNDQEYIWTLTGGSTLTGGRVSAKRFVRRANAYADAYIEAKIYLVQNLIGVQGVLPLRRNRDKSLNRLAVAGHGGNISLIRLNDDGVTITFDRVTVAAHTGQVSHATYDPETQSVVTCGQDGLIRVWRVVTTPNLNLVHVKTIVGGIGQVFSVGFANSERGMLLISTSQFGVVMAHDWSDGNPASTPRWVQTIDPGLYDRGNEYYEEQLPRFYGTYQGYIVCAYSQGFLLDPLTGRTVFVVPRLSTMYKQSFWAHEVGFHMRQAGVSYLPLNYWGVQLVHFPPARRHGFSSSPVADAPSPVTALEVYGDTQTTSLTIGLANGNIWRYQGVTSFSLAAQNNTTFVGQRVVRLIRVGAHLFAFGSNGSVHRLARDTLESTASVDAELEIMDADAIGSSDGVRIAIIGQTPDGQPRVRVYTYSNSTFSALQEFNPSGSLALGVRFLNTPQTLITLSRGVLRRYNEQNNNWTLAWSISTLSTSTRLEVSDADEILLGASDFVTPALISANGAVLLNAITGRQRVSAIAPTRYVWGVAQYLPSGDIAHGVSIGSNECNMWSRDLTARLSDEPLVISRPTETNVYYIGCADGTVWRTTLPTPQTKAIYDYNRLPQEFGVDDVVRTGIGYIPNAFRNFFSFCGRTDDVLLDVTDGSISARRNSGIQPDTLASYRVTRQHQGKWWRILENQVVVYDVPFNSPLTTQIPVLSDLDVARSTGNAYAASRIPVSYNNVAFYVPRVSILKPTPTGIQVSHFDAWQDASGNPIHGATTSGAYTAAVAVSADGLRVAVLSTRYLNSARSISIWRYDGSSWVFDRHLERGTNWGNYNATAIDFHPTRPELLYVGFSNGSLGLYDLNNPAPNPLTIYTSSPSVGSVGAVDIGEFILGGVNHTIMAFIGNDGMSVWVSNVCRPDCFAQTAVYNIDVGQSGGSISLIQPQPNGPVYAGYGDHTKHVYARIDTPLPDYCPADINNDGIVDDADLLIVLFNFGATGLVPGDANCDGTIDDADLLIVLFNFGNTCRACSN